MSGMEAGQTKLNPPASLTTDAVLALVERELEARDLAYDKAKGLWPTYYGLHPIRNGDLVPTWSVAFAIPGRTVLFRGKLVEVSEKMYFALVNDETRELVYIIHSAGYVE
jgi:hypothetical protein